MSKIAVVTGGTRGIGAAISKGLKKNGFTVAAIFARSKEKAEAFHKETGIATFQCDVSDPKACETVISDIEAQLGPVHTLVNNAGITRDSMLHKMDIDMWHDVITTNLNSLFYMTKPVIAAMRNRGEGRIISISSINGQKGQMGQTNYSAAKAGVIGFTKALALETARKGITVNCICPGYIDTDMVAGVPEKAMEKILENIPVGHLGKAEDIGEIASFLASDHAAFITGAVMSVNGGQYLANG